jgi:23S rRNA (adenine2030-N6)-methyltransferase
VNYRHAFHAGNFADVLKHVVLAKVVQHLNRKLAPWSFLDTHAGVGLYDLSGEEAERTGEWRNGVGRLRGVRLGRAAEALLVPWRAVLDEIGDGLYPGSPEIVRRMARADDRLRLCEKHPKDAAALGETMGRDRRVRCIEIDGWTALNAWLPPPERRGLVLIDPPFEEPGEHARMADAFLKAHRIWPTGTYLLWRPIKDRAGCRALIDPLARAGVPKLIDVELLAREPGDLKVLAGSGLVVVNPPWTLAAELAAGLPEIAKVLGQAPGARGRVETLSV